MQKPHYGLVGLAVMGANLALNIADHGFPLAVFNRTSERTREFMAGPAAGKPVVGCETIQEFVSSIERPRRIIILVKAGSAVDAVIGELRPLLGEGDVIIDGGNSFFQDTMRRDLELNSTGVHFIGLGVSGGEEGARHGPSLMPGGPREAYDLVEPVFSKIAAQVADGPCVTYLGPGGAGHYVKMVHNGIEYGDMQLIAETYNILRHALDMSAGQMSEVFSRWNEGRLNSYLIEITAKILATRDQDTGAPLVDLILDEAEQKGTGRWTTQNASELGIPIPTIEAAVWVRGISAMKPLRVAASTVLRGPREQLHLDRERLISALEGALYASKVSSYAQGMTLLRAASTAYSWQLNLAEIARIWKGGCIIRAELLDTIQRAFSRDPGLDNLLLDAELATTINGLGAKWRDAAHAGRALGLACPALNSSLDYFDAYRAERLPANLIQAQRDFFGAHTYKRIDRPGVFHTEWETHREDPELLEATSDPASGRGAVGEDEPVSRAGQSNV